MLLLMLKEPINAKISASIMRQGLREATTATTAVVLCCGIPAYPQGEVCVCVCVCVCVVLIRDFGAFCSLINVSVPNYGVCCLYFE